MKMRPCVRCKRFSALLDVHNTCNKCVKKAAPKPIKFEVRGAVIAPIRGNGYIISKTEWATIKREIDNFFYNTTQELIDEHNQTLRDEARTSSNKGSSMNKEGYVYLLKAETGQYKIGRSINISSRTQTIQRDFPIKIRLLHSVFVENNVQVEIILHQIFQSKRLDRTEWFNLEDDDAFWFLSLTSKNFLDKATSHEDFAKYAF